VPRFSTEQLSMSDVIVDTSPATVLQDAAPATVSASATTERVFDGGDQIRVFFQVYQGTARTDAIVPVTTRVRIIDGRGTVARDQSVVFAPPSFRARRTNCRITLPSNLPQGEYLLEIGATAGDQRQMRKLRFAIR
jgi:hypothetical protein